MYLAIVSNLNVYIVKLPNKIPVNLTSKNDMYSFEPWNVSDRGQVSMRIDERTEAVRFIWDNRCVWVWEPQKINGDSRANRDRVEKWNLEIDEDERQIMRILQQ